MVIALLVSAVLAQTSPAPAATPIGKVPWQADGRPAGEMQTYWQSLMKHLHDRPIRVLFVGDSITYNYTMGPGRAVYDTYFAPLGAFNEGVSGDTTQNTLASIQAGELDGIDPKVVYLMIGTNDVRDRWTGPDIARGVEAVVAAIHEKLPNARILLLDIFPRGLQPTSPDRIEVDRANAALDAYAFAPYVTRLDVNAAFLNADGTLKSQLFGDETLHPNAQGYAAIAPAIRTAIDAMLASSP